MTTKVHIVNFGPQAVSVKSEQNKVVDSILYYQQSTDVYVHREQTITIEEVPEFDAGGPPNVKANKETHENFQS
jgi:hypothetical protein